MWFREPTKLKIVRFLICAAIYLALIFSLAYAITIFYIPDLLSTAICWILTLTFWVVAMYYTVFYKERKETQLELLRLMFIRAPILIMIITLPAFIAFAAIGLCTIINDSWIRLIVFGIGCAILYAWWTGLTNLSNK